MSGHSEVEPPLAGKLREESRRNRACRPAETLHVKLAMAEERERQRVAICLHDEVGQVLAVATSKLDELRDTAASPDRANTLEEVREMVARALAASRSLTFELSSPALFDLGLEAALADLAERFEKRHGLRIRVAARVRPEATSDETAAILYRAVRELLCNVLKHARATGVTLSVVRADDEVRIAVEDDGIGFDADVKVLDENGGFGLFSIREQLAHLGGRFELKSTPGRGTRAFLAAPIGAHG